MLENSKIIEILDRITDPETGQGLVKANKIKDLKIRDKLVTMTLILPSLNVPYKTSLYQTCHETLSKELPEANVHIHIEAQAASAGSPQSPLPHIKNIIAVASGKGGVGKSTISSNLALGFHELGYKAGLLDADLYGPSIPTMFGLQGQKPKVRKIQGQPKLMPIEQYGIPLMSVGFVVDEEQAVILRGPRLAGLIKQFLKDCIWPELDVLVIDLPPGTGDIHLTLVQTVPVTGAVMVTTPQQVSLKDAIKASNMFRLDSINVPIIGVVENMSWFEPLEFLGNKYEIFGSGGGKELADYCQSKLVAQIPLIQSVGKMGDEGKPAVLSEEEAVKRPFIQMAEEVWKQLEKRNSSAPPTSPVFVNK